MTLEIANETDDVVHVALYKRSSLRPSEPAVAWAIVSPPPRGRAIFSIPNEYRVFARYCFSPEASWQPVYQTNTLSLRRHSDSLSIKEINLGRSAWEALLTRNVKKTQVGELRIENDFMIGVWCHVQLGEHDVQLPRLLPPRGVLTEALLSPFFLAVVSPLARMGSPLMEHEIHESEIQLDNDKGGAFTIRDSSHRGGRIKRGIPPTTRLNTQSTKANMEPGANPKKAKRVPKNKALVRPRMAAPKREEVKKPAKRPTTKPTKRRHDDGKAKETPSLLLHNSFVEQQASTKIEAEELPSTSSS